MATTFVKVEDKDKIQELWKAGLLWLRRSAYADGLPPPEPRYVPYNGRGTVITQRWFTDYGYLIED